MKKLSITPRYIVDREGKKKEVVIPVKQFDRMIELVNDALDVSLIEATEGEETITLNEYIRRRKAKKA